MVNKYDKKLTSKPKDCFGGKGGNVVCPQSSHNKPKCNKTKPKCAKLFREYNKNLKKDRDNYKHIPKDKWKPIGRPPLPDHLKKKKTTGMSQELRDNIVEWKKHADFIFRGLGNKQQETDDYIKRKKKEYKDKKNKKGGFTKTYKKTIVKFHN